MGCVGNAISSAQYSFFSFLLGPTGEIPGKFPQERAAIGARTAFAVWLAASFIFAKVGPVQSAWVGNVFSTQVAVLQPMIIQKDLGTSMMFIIAFSLGSALFTFIGVCFAALAWLIGGMVFRDWILFVFILLMPFLTVWASNIAALIPPKRVLIFAGDIAVWTGALPLFSFIGKGDSVTSLEPLAQLWVNYVAWYFSAAGVAFFATILPFGLGAIPGWRSIPSYLAATMHGLGGYASAVATGRCDMDNPDPMIEPRALLRHKVLEASASLRQKMMVAHLERCGGFYGQSPQLLELARGAEVCRLSLILQHAADLKPRPKGVQTVYYEGPFHEAVQDLQRITAKTLHGSASLAANIAGHDPPSTELSGYPWSGASYVSEDRCRRLSTDCSDAAHRFAADWADMSQQGKFGERLHGHNLTTEDILRGTPLPQVCQAEASVVGALAAAQAAAKAAAAVADYAAEMAENDANCTGAFTPCCGGIGILHWLSIPWAGPKIWWEALGRCWRFAVRLSVTLGILAIILITVQFPQTDPGHGMWAVISAGVLLTPSQGAGVLKCIRRIIGGIFGSLAALMVVLVAQWDFAGIWVWMGIAGFLVKFFEPELQYAGLAGFFTFCTIISKSLIYPDDVWKTLQAGFWRVAEIFIAVVVVGLVGSFIAPSRATPKVRSGELEALSCSATTCAAVARALSDARSIKDQGHSKNARFTAQTMLAGVQPSSKDEEGRGVDGDAQADEEGDQPDTSFDELRTSAWNLTNQFFFGGDGRPGIGDTLSDSRWESRVGTDAGYELFGGLFWVPTPYCCLCLDSLLAPGANCLDAVVDVSTLTRTTLVLVSLLQSGFQGGGSVLLTDPRVDEALGPAGSGFAEAVQGAVASIAPLLTEPGAEQGGVTRKLIHQLKDMEDVHLIHDGLSPREQAVSAARTKLDEAERRFQLLMVGAHAGRAKEGGALMSRRAAGNDGGPGTHRISAALFLLQETLKGLRRIFDALAGDETISAVNSSYAFVPGGSR